MAALDVDRYKLIVEALRYKLKNKNNPLLDKYKGWLYNGKEGIFWTARKNFPQFYVRSFPEETAEGNLKYAEFLIYNLDKRKDLTLLDYFKEETAPSLDPKTARVVDQAIKNPVPAGITASVSQATPTPVITHIPAVSSAPIPKQKQETPEQTETEVKPQPPQIPPTVINAAKNVSSLAQRSFKINSNRAINSFGQLLGSVGRSFTGALGGTVSGGLRTSTPFLSRAGNIAAKTIVGLTDRTARLNGQSIIPTPKRGVWLKVVAAFSVFVIIVGLNLAAGIFNPNATPSSQASPTGLNYTLPLRNPNIPPVDIRDQIRAAFPNAKLENWDVIIQRSITSNWNPAFVLALWIEESGAQGYPSYSDALGCAPGQPTTDINISLACLFNNFSNFTNDQFPEFMAKYSGGPASDPFSNNPNFTKNIQSWYSKLVPTGIGAIQTITSSIAYTPNGGAGIVSCPLNGAATITLGSKDAGGHCTPQYQAQEAPCLNPDVTGRSTAIDVQSSNKAVFLPTLGGQSADWIVDTTGSISDNGAYVGQDLAATASYNGKSYRIRFVHLDSTQLKIGSHYPSGTLVGLYRTAQNHVHITLQEDGTFKPADLYFNLCK